MWNQNIIKRIKIRILRIREKIRFNIYLYTFWFTHNYDYYVDIYSYRLKHYFFYLKSHNLYSYFSLLIEFILLSFSTYMSLVYGRTYVYTAITISIVVLNIIFFFINSMMWKKLHFNTILWKCFINRYKLDSGREQDFWIYVTSKWKFITGKREDYMTLYYLIIIMIYIFKGLKYLWIYFYSKS